ncbi:MAG: hypothetical protein KatS3mg043_1249 [Rhodothermaceae bacterium]|nr:MAG: hypothetical protein KatS3mg043_1249 [Rhodothermaceae bacterium]
MRHDASPQRCCGRPPACRRRAALLLAALVVLPTGLLAQEPDLGTEAQRAAGRQVYLEKCAQCHGENGDGQSYATPFLRPAPRDFTAGIFKFRTTPSGELPTTDDLRRSIREGMPYTSMPAWRGVLSSTEITNLAYFIKTFNDDFTGPYGVPTVVEIPRDPGFDEDNLERGRQVYEENQCADCHGNQGRGNGPSAPTLEDQWGFHIRPADLTKRWTFRNGQTRRDIYRTFTTGLDGSPMPSYDMPEEDRWALVDYVWSLSRSEPNYATAAYSHAVEGPLDLSRGPALFEEAEPAYFPVVGQVIEPGRSFYPGVNGIELRAVHNADEIAFLVTWHDLRADTRGRNGPDLPAPMNEPARPDTATTFSDAVALQFPATLPTGVERPYFLFGDRKNAVDLWFVDLAEGTGRRYIGRGYRDLQPASDGPPIEVRAAYDDGAWQVLFKRARLAGEGLSFPEDTFVPIAFSVWDGFNQERGNKRGITSWYAVYIAPLEQPAALGPALGYGLATLLLGLALVGYTRRKYRTATA